MHIRPRLTFTHQPTVWAAIAVLGVVLLAGSGLALRFGTAHAADTTDSSCTSGSYATDISTWSGNGTITFDCSSPADIDVRASQGGPGAVTVAAGQSLKITSIGASVTLDGEGATRLFLVAPPSGSDPGGTLELDDVTLQNGSATSSFGGAIQNCGTLTVNDSSFLNNSASYSGAIGNAGPGDGCDTGSNETVNASATIYGSTFEGNSAANNGGGVASDGTMTVTDSTFVDNTAGGNGGGASATISSLTIIASTLVGNHATGGVGGAIYAFDGGPNTPGVTIAGSIVAGNTAASGGANCDATGFLTDGGYNLEDSTATPLTDCGFSAASNDLLVANLADVDLGTLGNNGGPTETIPLATNSPAVDAIPNPTVGLCPGPMAPGGSQTDQRGVARPQGAGCDIGAYERAPSAGVHVTANPNPSLQGQSVQICAAVAGVTGTLTPTGTVTFKDGSTTLGSGTLVNGSVCISTSSLSVGGHTISAAYGGDSQFDSSTASVDHVVGVTGADVAGAAGGDGRAQASNGGATGNASGANSASGASSSGQQSQNAASSGSGTIASTSAQPSGSGIWSAGLGLGLLLLLVGLSGLGTILVRAARR